MSTNKPDPMIDSFKNNISSQEQIKENLLQEIKSIDYLLTEVPAWKANNLINQNVENELFHFYGTRRHNLQQLLTKATENPFTTTSIINDKTPAATPVTHNTFLIKPTVAPEKELLLEPDLPITPLLGSNTQTAQSNLPPRPIHPITQGVITPQNPILKEDPTHSYTHSPSSPPPPQKSLGELVSENINYIFASCAALFVGGVALYYRNELYYGLSQPIIQAAILFVFTLGFLVSGIFLVRETTQSTAGRCLTLVGALLVPINPWFLVSSHLIANTGRGWILGLACTLLYASISYFLKDPLFVYLSLVAGLLTSWVGTYYFSGNVSYFSSYATVLAVYSVLALLAENFFKVKEDNFPREKFGQPFFHFAQIGTAITLLFYTPLVTFLPTEFIATKMHFDPSYNSFLTVWLALMGAFIYGYSSATRRSNLFVYLTIAAIYWSEISLFIHLKSNFGQITFTILSTTLVLSLAGKFLKLEKLYIEPITTITTIIATCYGITSFVFLFLGATVSWWSITALIITIIIFQLDLTQHTKENSVYFISSFLVTAYTLSLTKLSLDISVFLLLVPVPVFGTLFVSYLKDKSNKSEESYFWQNTSLVCVGVAIYELIFSSIDINVRTLIFSAFFLEISLGLAIFSGLTKKKILGLVTAILASSFLVVSYSLCLSHFGYTKGTEAFLAFAILAFAYYGVSKINLLWEQMRQAFSYVSTVLVGILLFCLLTIFTNNFLDLHIFTTHSYLFLVIAVLVIGVKEFLHLWNDRDALHSVLFGISGMLGLGLILETISLPNKELILIAEIALAIGYLLISNVLLKQNVPIIISTTFEALSNISIIFNAIGLLVIGYNSYTNTFSSFTSVGYFAIAVFYALATQLTKEQPLTKTYGIAAFSGAFFLFCLIGNYLGLHTWADLAALLIPILIGYLIFNHFLEKTKFNNAPVAVAQVAQPVVIFLGIISSLSHSTPPLGGAIFFAEIATFYFFLGLLKKQTYALYIGLFTSILSLWKLFEHLSIGYNYFAVFCALYGATLIYISTINKGEKVWVNEVLSNAAHGILGFSATALVLQTFASVALGNSMRTPNFVSLVIMISIFSWASTILEKEILKQIYKNTAIVLSGVAYICGGSLLGFSLISQTEFYTLPLAIFLLRTGYLAKAIEKGSANVWLGFGSVLVVLPTLLHVMNNRFISHQPSAGYDFILLFLSLTLMIPGMLTAAKPLAHIGQAAFIIELSIIVFSAVNWEQQGLSVVMILLAVAIFVAAWLIHNHYKKNQPA